MNVGRPLRVPGAIGSFVLQDTQTAGQLVMGDPDPAKNVITFVMRWTPSDKRAYWIQGSGNPVTAVASSHLTNILPQVTGIRPLRQTLILRNTSAADKVGGSVRVLNIPETVLHEFNADGTIANVTGVTINSLLHEHPESRMYSAQEFRRSKAISLFPASSSGARMYHETLQPGAATLSAIMNHDTASPAMNTLLIQISYAAGNTYDFSLHTQDACHVISNGSLQNQRQMPLNIAEGRHQNAVQLAQQNAAMLVDAEEEL